MSEAPEIYTVADHITVWIPDDGGSIHIKTREPYGDPVELNEHQAAELVGLLQSLITKLG